MASCTVTVLEFRKNLAKWLDLVGRGTTVIVTRRGTPIAQLSPPGPMAWHDGKFEPVATTEGTI